ncbi:MAG: cob(I)yrinic acid a,c-diamide adenosyltransferase [Acidobacteriota bacterium]
MPRIHRVYTRTGDEGTTALGTGSRVEKDAARVEAFGAVDELNTAIGVAVATGVAPELAEPLQGIQNDLFHLGADLCVPERDKADRPGPAVEKQHVESLEALMDRLTATLAPLANFVLPGGGAAGAALHTARTVCRRAERRVVTLSRSEPVGKTVVPYLNRLSDALFVMARFQNKNDGVADVLWNSRA